jgi:hypothetical protein
MSVNSTMTKSRSLLTGIVVFLLVIGIVSPVMAAEEHMSAQNHENDDNQQVNDDDRHATEENFSHFSHEGYDEKHHCPAPVPPSYTAILNLTIDNSLMNATPHWMFLVAGKTEQIGLLTYIRQANISAKKKAQWSLFMMKSWMKYPVKYIKTEDGAILVPGKTPNKFSMTKQENQTFQDIERYIAEDMSKIQSEEPVKRWVQEGTHRKFMGIALGDKYDTVGELKNLAIVSADAPDNFCDNSPIPDCQQINHGFVPIGIILNPVIIMPSTIYGLGRAPDNFGDYASKAKLQFALHDYNGAFTNMGYASHFITDLGNPFHTPNAQIIDLEYVDSPLSNIIFPNSKMIINYKDLHNNYETMVDENWDKYYYENTDTYYILDPTYSAKVHGTYSWAANYPLVYNCYWHYVLTKNMDFSQDPVITAITLNRITESMKQTRGLVDYVTGGQPVVNYIQTSHNPNGEVSTASTKTARAPALEDSPLDLIFGLISVPFGQDETVIIEPDTGYVISDVVVDGVSNGSISSREFRNVREDHVINVTFTPEESICSMLMFTDANFKSDAVQYFNSGNIIPAGNYTLNVTGWNSQWSYDMGWWEEGVTTQASKSAIWRNMTNLWVEGEITPLSTIVTGEFAHEDSWGSALVNISSPSRVGIVLVDNPYYDNRGAATFVLRNAGQTCPATAMKQSVNLLPSIATDENGMITNETFVETKK